ncbi:hypothetical protein [Mycobacterium sp. MS1601]|jgi:hypothetical protein|nr:hypothetical protein [Mycobacterium sp. MS1601]
MKRTTLVLTMRPQTRGPAVFVTLAGVDLGLVDPKGAIRTETVVKPRRP